MERAEQTTTKWQLLCVVPLYSQTNVSITYYQVTCLKESQTVSNRNGDCGGPSLPPPPPPPPRCLNLCIYSHSSRENLPEIHAMETVRKPRI